MDDRTRCCTWDVFCEHLASYAGDEDFALVVQDMGIDLGLLNDLPEDKIFVSSASDTNRISAGVIPRSGSLWPYHFCL